MITTITDSGDSFVLTGIVATGTLYLFFSGCRKGAFALLLALVLSAALITFAKLLFIGCNGHFKSSYGIYSPSGHSALSVAVFGTYALIIASQLKGIWRLAPALIFVPLIIAIAVTRILLNYHTLEEVLLGLTVGVLTLLAVYIFLKRGNRLSKFNLHALLLYTIVAAALLHGFHSPAEHIIEMLASYISAYAPACAK